MIEGEVYIDGTFAPARSGRTLPCINPADEQPIGQVPACDADDVDRAVRAACRAFDQGPWGRCKAPERARAMLRIAEGIRRRADELARIETQDSGKPLYDNLNADVPDAAACFEHFAGWASTLTGATIELPFGDFHDYTIRQPVGVVAAIAPWNFPLVNAAWKIAPAIAAGNCIVYKPAADTSLSALVLARILDGADLPPGVVNIVTGTGGEVGAAMTAHPGIDKISFTGSTEVGRNILHAAADGIKPATVELGGKSANIVFADCEIEKAIDGTLMSIFYNAGQVCTAGARLLVERSVYGQFMERLAAAAMKIRVGDPMDLGTRMGPLVSATHHRRVMDYIEAGRRDGAVLRCGGGRPAGWKRGCYLAPTIYERVPIGSTLDREEVFGPVLVAHPFDDEDAAITLANATPYGLAGGIWTRDLSRAHRLARRLEAGTVWVNTYNIAAVNAPNPGFKASGIGSELGREGFLAYTRIKNVCIDLDPAAGRYFGG